MKSTIFLAATILLVIALIFYRRRLKLAVLVAGGMYLAVIASRLLFGSDDPDRFQDLAIALGGLALAWGAVWGVTRVIERRRASRSPRSRRARR